MSKVELRKIVSTDLLPVIYGYLTSIGLDSVANKLASKSGLDLENSESPLASKKLQKIVKFYVTNHKEMIKKFMVEQEEEEEEEEEPVVTKKDKKNKKKNNKRKHSAISDANEEEKAESGTETPVYTGKKAKLSIPLPVIPELEGVEEELQPGDRKYFQKCDDRRLAFIKSELADNSHEAKRKFGQGDGFGDEGNNKLKVVQGKQFRKEKDKLKNKGFCGGSEGINTSQINSIML